MTADVPIVGRILRASTRGFACGTHSSRIGDIHDFGAFVKAPIANSREGAEVLGIIYKVDIQDDQLVTELVMGDNVPENVLRDQRNNRMIPVEISALNVGFMVDGQMIQNLPPRPPLSLSEVMLCTAEEVFDFTQRHDYFRLILDAADVPTDDLLAASIRYAQWAYVDEARYDFLVGAGRELARQLSNDLKRLSHLLALIRP